MMEDTDWRPSHCPHCGELREAQRNPVCRNVDCVPKSRTQQLVGLLNRPFGSLTAGEKKEVAARITELQARLTEVTAERDGALCEMRQRFAELELAYDHAETYSAAIPVAYQMALDAGFDAFCAIKPATAKQLELWDNVYDAIRALTPPADLVEQVVAKAKGGE